jgi:hypothetical protein
MRYSPEEHRIGSFRAFFQSCGDGIDGKGPSLLKEPDRGKKAQKIPLLLLSGGPPRKTVLPGPGKM